MDERPEKPEPAYITDAKRSAEKTGLIAIIVIFTLLAIGEFFVTVSIYRHGRTPGVSIGWSWRWSCSGSRSSWSASSID